MKFGIPLRYALSKLAIEFHKNQMGDNVIMTSKNEIHKQTFENRQTYSLTDKLATLSHAIIGTYQ